MECSPCGGRSGWRRPGEPGDHHDVLADIVDIAKDVVVPEAEDGPAVLFEARGSLSASFSAASASPCCEPSTSTTSFLAGAGEVDDVSGNRELPAEAQAHQSMCAKFVPQLQLGVGHDPAHLLGVCAVSRVGMMECGIKRRSVCWPAGRSRLYVAPLCPAGHLPHKGGDWPAALVSPIFATLAGWRKPKLKCQSPPLWGRCPAGQRGALSRQTYPSCRAAALTASPPTS